MAQQYCSNCGQAVMPTMRICPSCGHKSFGASPPTPNGGSSGGVTPNAPPQPIATSQAPTGATTQTSFLPAGHWRRIIAYAIDYFIITIAVTILGAIAGIAGVGEPTIRGMFSGSILLLLSICLPFAYFTYMHSKQSGATLGKSAMRIKVVTVGGERLSKITAFTRIFLTLLVPIAGWILVGLTAAGTLTSNVDALQTMGAISTGIGALAIVVGPYLTVFFNAQHQTLFDLICKTCVIKI